MSKDITLTPQAIILLDYFKSGKTISNLIAIGNMGIGSLTKRVAELRAKGYDIKGVWKVDHHGKRYKEYSLAVAEAE